MRFLVLATVLVPLAACESSGTAPKRPPVAPVEMPNVEQQIATLEAASRPGPMHKRLDVLRGEWETRVARVAPDGSEIPAGTGHTTITPLYEGRYLRWDARMTMGGRPQETSGWLGYDLNAGEYQLSMITSFSSGMGVYRGRGDLATDGIAFTLEQLDPRSGARLRAKNRLKLVAPGHFVIEDLDEDERVRARSHYTKVAAGVRS